MTRHAIRQPDTGYYTGTHADREWMRLAACRGCDPELWFPPDRRGYNRIIPLLICHECPVIGDCLTYALSTDTRFGIWGGLTEQDRATISGRRVYG